jgi:hypothetical protein
VPSGPPRLIQTVGGSILPKAQKSGGEAWLTSVHGEELVENWLFNLYVKSVFLISLICNQKYFEEKY